MEIKGCNVDLATWRLGARVMPPVHVPGFQTAGEALIKATAGLPATEVAENLKDFAMRSTTFKEKPMTETKTVKQEVTERADEAVEPALTAKADAIAELIARAAAGPGADLSQVAVLSALHDQALDRAAKSTFLHAFAALQQELPTIDKNGAILNSAGKVSYRYAGWEDINDALRPLLFKHGFTLSFRPGGETGGRLTVTGILRHVDGHQDEAVVSLPADASGSMNTVQGVGSSLSYGKRYAAIALLNITSRAKEDRDDDGVAAGRSEVTECALVAIGKCSTLSELREWKREKYAGVENMVSANDAREIVAICNLRAKKLKVETEAASVLDRAE